MAGGPPGSNGDPDGRYNFNAGLLDGIQPYAYGQGRMGSDRNYQQIPHRIQEIIPLLYLPHADNNIQDLVPLSHAVDMGDIAFVLGTHRVQGVIFDRNLQLDSNISKSSLPSRNAFVNLPTVNYLLAGLQRLGDTKPFSLGQKQRDVTSWGRLAQDLDYNPMDKNKAKQIIMLLRTGFVPFGICAGSEDQGGQHETGFAPVQAAANHVTTMTVDGQNRDLVNFWRRNALDAGDEIIFRLEYLPTQNYTLNHYYKGIVHQMFPNQQLCWQLVPDVFRMTYNKTKYDGMPRNVCDYMPDYDYRLHGYWRIGQMFHSRARNDNPVQNYADDGVFLQGGLLHITFAPVWVQHEYPQNKASPDQETVQCPTNSIPLQCDKKRKGAFGFGLKTKALKTGQEDAGKIKFRFGAQNDPPHRFGQNISSDNKLEFGSNIPEPSNIHFGSDTTQKIKETENATDDSVAPPNNSDVPSASHLFNTSAVEAMAQAGKKLKVKVKKPTSSSL